MEPNEQAYEVVVNDEGQYSLWPSGKLLPAGWPRTGSQGSKQACLDHIGNVWNDMRPASLRSAMDGSVRT